MSARKAKNRRNISGIPYPRFSVNGSGMFFLLQRGTVEIFIGNHKANDIAYLTTILDIPVNTIIGIASHA